MIPTRIPRATVRWASAATAMAVIAGLFYAAQDERSLPLSPADTRAPGVAPAEIGPVAQQTYLSRYCQTQLGICELPTALPVGSPCQCAGTTADSTTEGRVVP